MNNEGYESNYSDCENRIELYTVYRSIRSFDGPLVAQFVASSVVYFYLLECST